ncbi:MAG: hypothetical protein Q9166_006651 [cf. Caloplaca sp. 2 TL-2023]
MHLADFQPSRPPVFHSPTIFPVTPAPSTKHTTGVCGTDVTVETISGRPLIQGASFNTQFHGMTHSINIIGYFDGLRAFLDKTATDHPVLGAHRWAVQNLTKGRQAPNTMVEAPEAVMKRLLPPEPVCRSLMHAYFKHFEGMFRILHAPSFWRRYDTFWASSNDRLLPFNALLLAAISCARCLYVDNPLSFDGDCSASRAEATQWVRAAERWHDQQSPKHTSLDIFQVKCLTMLSKRVNAIKMKRHYTLSQTLLASAISIGLHRSPSSLGDRASTYEKEMRRRLWSTISELELAESMERGVPSLVANLYSDIEPPANFRDEDFGEMTTNDPLTQQDETLTTSSFSRYAHKFRPLQHTINNLTNDPEKHKALSSSELNKHHDQIFNRFFDLQSWPTSQSSLSYSDANFIAGIYLRVQLHKLLIMLHLPFAIGGTQSATTSHSRLVCSNSSKSVIDIYARLADQGFSQMCLPRTDLMRATLCLCLIESTSTSFGTYCFQTPSQCIPTIPVLVPSLHKTNLSHGTPETIYTPSFPTTSPMSHIESALNMVEERILALGDGFRGFWLLFAASCSIMAHNPGSNNCQTSNSSQPDRATDTSAAAAAWQEKIVNHVIVLCSKICLCQVNRSNGAGGSQESADALFASCSFKQCSVLILSKVYKSFNVELILYVRDEALKLFLSEGH